MRFYGPSSRSMCHRTFLWTLIQFYEPLRFNEPSFRSMCRHAIRSADRPVGEALCVSMDLHLVLCAIVRFYGPLSSSMSHCDSMSLRSVLCAVTRFNVPSFRSMSRYAFLWAFLSFYVPSYVSMDPYPVL